MNEGCSFVGLAATSQDLAGLPDGATGGFPGVLVGSLSPLGHTVISSALDFQPLYLKILGAGGKEGPASQGLPYTEAEGIPFSLEHQN